jgi:general secretion pathway protein I
MMSRACPPLRQAQRASHPERLLGFTLVEVLVALVIVALGMSALLGTMGSAADTAAYLRDKTFAQWIALNHLAEVRLTKNPPSKGTSDGEVEYAGRRWRWSQEVTALDFPGMLRVDVKVQQSDTPAGKDAPWMAQVTGVSSDSLASPVENSDYLEYAPNLPGAPGTTNPLGTPATPGGLNPAGNTTTPTTPTPTPTPKGLGSP